MKTLNFKVNFSGADDKQDIIKKLVSVFRLPNSPKSNWNWDAFEDYFTSLDSDSEIIRNMDPKPKQVNLIIKNIKDVKKILKKITIYYWQFCMMQLKKLIVVMILPLLLRQPTIKQLKISRFLSGVFYLS